MFEGLFLIGFVMIFIGIAFCEDRIKEVGELFFLIGLFMITAFFIAYGIKLIIQN
jgi:hypothetical protein